MKLLPILLIFILLLFPACLTIERTIDEVRSFEISGTMHYNPDSGGCWVFIGNDGEVYEITGMRVIKLLRPGLRADLVVRGPLESPSVCNVSQIVELIEIIRTY